MQDMAIPFSSTKHDPFTLPYSYTPLPESPTASSHRRRRPSMLLAAALGVILLVGTILSFANKNGNPNPIEIVPEKILRGVREGVSIKSFGAVAKSPAFQWSNRLLVWQKTGFHFQPEKNWMNDPNGPLFYKGWYHFFYQYNPFGAVWGNIAWAHAVSEDLIHWRHLPIAMFPDQWYDANGVWTGSATILQDGRLVMLYTGSTNSSVQVQNLAYPADPSDPFLTNWVKYPGNPVLVPPPGIGSKDFRDPTTAWLTSEGKWRITIGSKVNKTGIALVYDTADFKSFELRNGVLHGVQGTGMWECVDFYPVSRTNENGLDTSVDGAGVKHVVKASLDDDRNDYYALGSYDSGTGKWTPDDPALDVGIGLRYDYGTFYASKTFFDQEKKRRVLWGWIKETDTEAADMQKGWASVQAIPRTIVFDKKMGSNILQWPVEEVELLRTNKKVFDKVEAKPGSIVPLDVGTTSQLDILVEFEVDRETLEKMKGSNATYNCNGSDGVKERGALGPFGLLVHANDALTEQTPIYFYITKNTRGNFATSLCADHSRSSEASDVDKAIYGSSVPVLEGEKLALRVLVDHSIVESFAQGGRTCITSRVYPTKGVEENSKIYLFNNATDVRITASLQIWQMRSSNSWL